MVYDEGRAEMTVDEMRVGGNEGVDWVEGEEEEEGWRG